MAKQTKRDKARTGDRTVAHAVTEAVKLVKANATTKFDESIEIAVNLGVDPRHADQQVRGVVSLPSGTGRDVRVAVIAKDAKAAEATASAEATARRLLDGEKTDGREARADRMFELVLGARATAKERAELLVFIDDVEKRLTGEGDSEAALRAWSMACHALFASSRFQVLE